MPKKPIKNIHDFFELVGGTNKLAAKLALHQFTVDRWRKFGIPLKYWEQLIELTSVTPAELYYISKKCLEKRKSA